MFSIIPYFLYLLGVYILIDYLNFYYTVLISTVIWVGVSFFLIKKWDKVTAKFGFNNYIKKG